MLKLFRAALIAVVSLGGLVGATSARAMPMYDSSVAATATAAASGSVENVRLVCGYRGCVHRPYGYGFHRGWRRWPHPHGYGYRWHRWHHPYGYRW